MRFATRLHQALLKRQQRESRYISATLACLAHMQSLTSASHQLRIVSLPLPSLRSGVLIFSYILWNYGMCFVTALGRLRKVFAPDSGNGIHGSVLAELLWTMYFTAVSNCFFDQISMSFALTFVWTLKILFTSPGCSDNPYSSLPIGLWKVSQGPNPPHHNWPFSIFQKSLTDSG